MKGLAIITAALVVQLALRWLVRVVPVSLGWRDRLWLALLPVSIAL